MSDLMTALRHTLGLAPRAQPTMSDEQARVAARLNRIAIRQKLIDIQADVLAADTRDARRPR